MSRTQNLTFERHIRGRVFEFIEIEERTINFYSVHVFCHFRHPKPISNVWNYSRVQTTIKRAFGPFRHPNPCFERPKLSDAIFGYPEQRPKSVVD